MPTHSSHAPVGCDGNPDLGSSVESGDPAGPLPEREDHHSTHPSQQSTKPAATHPVDSIFGTLRHSTFRGLWIASLFSNLGSWTHEVGAGWLMTSLDSSPTMVSSVRTAMAMPVVFLALFAGALADRLDRRILLLCTQIVFALSATLLAILTVTDIVTPSFLLCITFFNGILMAIQVPTWQAVIPHTVPKSEIPSAIALGSLAFNIARTAGPAAGGYLVAAFGPEAAFTFNAVSFLGIIVVLLRWKGAAGDRIASTDEHATPLPKPERSSVIQSVLEGVRFVIRHPILRNVKLMAMLYVFPASCFWALLPLLVREDLHLGAEGFGTMVGLFGGGAVTGIFIQPILRRYFTTHLALGFSMACAASSLFVLSLSNVPTAKILVTPFLGLAWMCALTLLQSTSQFYLPNAIRARGMACYLTVFSLSMGLGSWIWGLLASWTSLQQAYFFASLCLATSTLLSLALPLGSLRSDSEPSATPK